MQPQKVTLTESEAAALYGPELLERAKRKWNRRKPTPPDVPPIPDEWKREADRQADGMKRGRADALKQWEQDKADAERRAQWSRRAGESSAVFRGKSHELPPLFPDE